MVLTLRSTPAARAMLEFAGFYLTVAKFNFKPHFKEENVKTEISSLIELYL